MRMFKKTKRKFMLEILDLKKCGTIMNLDMDKRDTDQLKEVAKEDLSVLMVKINLSNLR